MWVGGNVCCVEGVVIDSGHLSLGVVKHVVCLCRDVMDVVFLFVL